MKTRSKLINFSLGLVFSSGFCAINVDNYNLSIGSKAQAWIPECGSFNWQKVDINTNLNGANCTYQSTYDTAAIITGLCESNLSNHYSAANKILASKGRNWRFLYVTDYQRNWWPKRWVISRIK